MPVRFACDACGLVFAVGSYHADGLMKDGYAAITLTVCKACGAQHRVRIAVRTRGPEYLVYFDVMLSAVPSAARVGVIHRLRSELGLTLIEARHAVNEMPCVLGKRLSSSIAQRSREAYTALGAVVDLVECDRERNEDFGPLQRDALEIAEESADRWSELEVRGRSQDACGEFDLAQQHCGRCNEPGTLIGDENADWAACPGCKRTTLRTTGGWVTQVRRVV